MRGAAEVNAGAGESSQARHYMDALNLAVRCRESWSRLWTLLTRSKARLLTL